MIIKTAPFDPKINPVEWLDSTNVTTAIFLKGCWHWGQSFRRWFLIISIKINSEDYFIKAPSSSVIGVA